MIRVPEIAVSLLRCPICRAPLNVAAAALTCTKPPCAAAFPLVDGIPILINDNASIFSVDDFVAHRTTTLATGRPNAVKTLLKSVLGTAGFERLKALKAWLMPSIDKNISGARNYARVGELLATAAGTPLVLVLGGGILGQGIAALMRNSSIRVVESDVSFGPRTAIILDAHDIPFADGSFDAVIAQAVLEHVADPYRCVEEIHRVLKKDGLIYAETPFMQQVHAGRYDFTRFTHLGHRRLFRRFTEIDSGIVCGPGMALAWAYQYFLTSFVTARILRSVARTLARFTSFHLKYFDPFLAGRAGAYDAASGFYLLGRKAELPLSDRELLRLYRGLDSQ
jgi:SAM-dependent methyltransferase